MGGAERLNRRCLQLPIEALIEARKGTFNCGLQITEKNRRYDISSKPTTSSGEEPSRKKGGVGWEKKGEPITGIRGEMRVTVRPSLSLQSLGNLDGVVPQRGKKSKGGQTTDQDEDIEGAYAVFTIKGNLSKGKKSRGLRKRGESDKDIRRSTPRGSGNRSVDHELWLNPRRREDYRDVEYLNGKRLGVKEQLAQNARGERTASKTSHLQFQYDKEKMGTGE